MSQLLSAAIWEPAADLPCLSICGTSGIDSSSENPNAPPMQSCLADGFGSPANSPSTNPSTPSHPVLLRSENSYSHQIVEVSVESETDGLDEDQLQLSLRQYRSGKVDPLPFVPAATFTMKIEDGIWRLNDISVNLRLPLGDKVFLDSLAPGRRPPHVEELESAAIAYLRTLNTAQVSYAATFQELGFACSVANLGGSGEDEATAASAGLIDAGLSSGSLDGYRFSIEGCFGSPVDHFSISAVPESAQSGMRAFCSDESGAIRFSEDGSAATCLSDGEPLQ